VLALLIGYWPSARDAYPALFRALAATVFESDGPDLLLLRPAVGDSLAEKDTFVEAFDADGGEPHWRLVISAVRLGYWPSAVLMALLLATPLSARRRLLAVGAGLAWLHAFALLRLSLEIQRAFGELEGAGVEAGGSLLAYRTASEVLNSNIVVIAAVFLGWVAVSRPRKALEMGALSRLLGRPGPSAPTPVP
jgi:hypothetical protein